MTTPYLPEPTTAAEVIARARAVEQRRRRTWPVAEPGRPTETAREASGSAPPPKVERPSYGRQKADDEARERAADEARYRLIDGQMARARRAIEVAKHGVPISEIVETVADCYGASVIDLKSMRRTKGVVLRRQIAMALARELTTRSLPDIGRYIGDRDHTTVLHAVRKIEALAQTDDALREALADIREKLTGSREIAND